jgi:hypothetical protein
VFLLRRSKFQRVLLGALSATAALLAACSSSPGPLGSGGTQGQQCFPGRPGEPVTLGLYTLQNSGASTATITSVSLPTGASGLKMTRAWVVPIYHDPKTGNLELIGVGWPYPPTSQPTWPQRRPAVGAVIKPGQDLNLVFGLIRTTSHDGRSDGPVIAYTANGSTYTMKEAVSLLAAASHC